MANYKTSPGITTLVDEAVAADIELFAAPGAGKTVDITGYKFKRSVADGYFILHYGDLAENLIIEKHPAPAVNISDGFVLGHHHLIAPDNKAVKCSANGTGVINVTVVRKP